MLKLSCSLFSFLFIFCVFLTCVNAASCPEQLPGIVKWSVWSKKPASSGEDVSIGASEVILLDAPSLRLGRIDVWGTLVIDPSVPSIALNFTSLYVRNGGKLFMGSEDCPLLNTVTITLLGIPLPGSDPLGVGTKVLGVLAGGLLEIHGKPRKPVWTVLAQTAPQNSSQITLIEDVDWAVGESIVIATTDFEDFSDEVGYPATQNERVVITGRPSAKVVSFSPPLSFSHYGKIWTGQNGDQIDMRGEVGVINRNILIVGDVDSTFSGESLAQKWGGHVMIRDGGQARIENLEVTLLGQKGEFGRYPLHFHNSSTQPNSYLRSNSIHDTFQRCIVVHSTFNLRVQNNFAYRGMGHCYFIEDGNEEQNVFEHNLGIKALVGTLLESDNQPAMFWITNPMNHFYENVAVGGKFGFWYSMPEHPLALSASQTSNLLRYKKNGDFVNNKAHSGSSGLFLDSGLKNAKPGAVESSSSYNPVNWTLALDLAAKLGKPVDVTKLDEYARTVYGFRDPATFVGFVAYKNTDNGMWGRGTYMYNYGAKLADNVVGCVWPGAANLLVKSIIVGETDNVGTPNIKGGIYGNWWGDEEGRTRAAKWWLDQPVVGYSSYDAGGGDFVMDVNFYNFNDYAFTKGTNAGRVRKTGAITGITGPNVIQPKNRIYRATFNNVQNRVYYRQSVPWVEGYLADADDAVKGIVWVDADGSLLAGTSDAGCGKTIVGAGALVRTSDCVAKPDWNAYICPANANAHRAIQISQDDTTVNSATYNQTTFRWATDLHVQRISDNAKLDIEADIRDRTTYYTAEYSYGTNILMNNVYYFTLGNKNTFLSKFRAQLFDFPLGEAVRFGFPVPSSAAITVTTGNYDGSGPNAKQVQSYSALTVDSYYVDTSAGILWIHLEATSVDYDYYYGTPVYSNVVAFGVSIAGCDASTGLCTYTAKSAPTGLTVTGKTANLCETNGAKIGSKNTYTTKSSSVYTLFNDSFVYPFALNDVYKCNVSTEMMYEGRSSLKCTLGNYDYTSFTRVWDNTYENVIPVGGYTHLQLAVRVAPGFGTINLGLSIFNRSYQSELEGIRMWSPEYTDDAGPISDSRWSLIRIPLSMLAKTNLNLWGFAIFNYFPRAVIIYVDSVQFVSLNQVTQKIPNFPVAPPKPIQLGPGPQVPSVIIPTSDPSASTSATSSPTDTSSTPGGTSSGGTTATPDGTTAQPTQPSSIQNPSMAAGISVPFVFIALMLLLVHII